MQKDLRLEEAGCRGGQPGVQARSESVKVNVWACFAECGCGCMHICNENMDGKLYAKIVSDRRCQDRAAVGQQRYFLVDNAATHQSDRAKVILHNVSFIALDFRPCSLDFSSSKHLRHLAPVK